MPTLVVQMVLAAVIVGLPTGIEAQGPGQAGLSHPTPARQAALQPTEIEARAGTWGRQKITTVIGAVLGAVGGVFVSRSLVGPDLLNRGTVILAPIFAAIGAFVGHVFGDQGPSTGNAST